jgi:glycosyltransferase involved in cell wall biosynthesis
MPPEKTESGTSGKKRILFVTQTTGYGGSELHLIQLIESFPTSIRATIVCFGIDPYTRLIELNSRVQARVSQASRPRDCRGYWSLFRGFHPDIVVFISGWHGLFPLAAYLAARFSMARRVCTIEHSTAEERSPWPKTWLSPRGVFRWIAGWYAHTTLTNGLIGRVSDQTICVSEKSRTRLVREYAYPHRKTSTVRNGVEASRYLHSPETRLKVRRSLGIGPEESVIVCVGRLHRDKGLDILFESLCRLRQERPCKCIVVGDGPSRSELAAFVAENGLSSTVMFVGFQDDVRPYLATADVFVLPSRSPAEALPFSLLEAMSSGLACIATDVGGVREVVSDGVDGLVVAPEIGGWPN